MKKRGIVSICLISAFMVMLNMPFTVQADNKYWVGGTGWWDISSNWSLSGQPQNGDNVYLTQIDDVNRTVSYQNSAYPSAVLNMLIIDATGSGTMTLSQGQDNLSVGYETIGAAGSGKFTQSGGIHTVNNYLYLGDGSSSNGTYELSGSGILNAGNEIIGLDGTGKFTQSGGTNTVTSTLYLGQSNNGIYELSGTGILNADYENIGTNGNGTFTQSGGTNTVTSNLILGENDGSNGTYNLIGGTLDVKGSITGGSGASTINIDGGALTNNWSSINVNTFNVGYSSGSHGAFTMESKNLTAGSEFIGASGTGKFTQVGGINTILYTFGLGQSTGSDGTYELSGTGALHTSGEAIGIEGTGKFTQSGGTNTDTTNLVLGGGASGNGTYELSGDGALLAGNEFIGYEGTGKFIQSGGTNTDAGNLVLGYNSGSSGTYELSGTGVLHAGNEYIGQNGIGKFTQSGGTNTVTGTLFLGSDVSGNGTYELSGDGTLQASNEYIGLTGTGKFTQSGGTNTIIDFGSLYLGSDPKANGSYELGGTGALNSGYENIGVNGAGKFTQSGGTNTVIFSLVLGNNAGSNGTYELGGTGALLAANEFVGDEGTGKFTQSGGTHTVTNNLTIGYNTGSNGTYDLSGGTLTAGNIINNDTFSQSGGIINGTLQNNDTFTYSGGVFNNRLINNGIAVFNADFTAGDGMENNTDLTISNGRTITMNGHGLENNGAIILAGGKLSGNGPLVNNNFMSGFGAIAGTGGFVNNNIFTQSGSVTLSNTGANANYGEWDLAGIAGKSLNLGSSVTLANRGDLHLNGSLINGAGTLDNSFGGAILGHGAITSNFRNSAGVLVVDSLTSITKNFNNGGEISLTGTASHLTGGAITNRGTIQGQGNVGNSLANTGIIETRGGDLTLTGESVTNNAGGLMVVTSGNKLLVAAGVANNAGGINFHGGTFDNNNKTMTSTGMITGYGTFRTGELTNSGIVTLTGGPTTVNGDIINQTGGMVHVAHSPAVIMGNVTNNGTFKTTDTTVTFAGSFTNSGAYISDPSTNHFYALTIGQKGYMQGGLGDNFYVETDLLNYSIQNAAWNTNQALLGFAGSGSHNFSLAGADQGATMSGYANNFAWGELNVEGSIYLSDGNTATTGGAQYVDALIGAVLYGTAITNIHGQSGLNIYYLASAAENSYLKGLTYDLADGGKAIPVGNPVPVPASLWLLAAGLSGLVGIRRRYVK